MKVRLVGLQPLDFESKDGGQIKGIKLHVSFQDENVMGYACDTKFLTAQSCKNLGITVDDLEPMIGQVVDIETNLKGRVTGINPV